MSHHNRPVAPDAEPGTGRQYAILASNDATDVHPDHRPDDLRGPEDFIKAESHTVNGQRFHCGHDNDRFATKGAYVDHGISTDGPVPVTLVKVVAKSGAFSTCDPVDGAVELHFRPVPGSGIDPYVIRAGDEDRLDDLEACAGCKPSLPP